MAESTATGTRCRLGDFEIVRELGRGGMGIVYEAVQVSLHRKVALKVLSSSLGLTSKAVIRFKREAEAAAKLHHTNIVPIYATGEIDGTHYYAMELIEGPGLDQVIAQLRQEHGQIPQSTPPPQPSPQPATSATTLAPGGIAQTMGLQAPPSDASSSSSSSFSSTSLQTGSAFFDTVAKMMAEVADALDYAHAQGVIHRDIKPSNILLSPFGKLSMNDFGLARMLEQPGMTVSGEFVGSPMYMSPEQITAGRAPLDHRTDIYSLGATLYELLTLQPPYQGVRRDQVIAQIIGKEARPPRAINRKIPQDLETICLKMMEKDPDKRYQTAGAVAEDLRRYVNRFAISARRVGPLGRTVRWVKRHQAVSALITCALVAVIIAAFFARQLQLSNQQRRQHDLQQAVEWAETCALTGDLEKTEAAIQQAERKGASTGWVRLLRGQLAYWRDDFSLAAKELEQANKLMPDDVGILSLLARAYAGNGRWDLAEPILNRVTRLPARNTRDLVYKGLAEARDINEVTGIQTLDKAIQQADRRIPLAYYIRADAWLTLAMETGQQEHIDRAIEHATTAKSLLADVPGMWRGYAASLHAHTAAASLYRERGLSDRRKQELEEAEKDRLALEPFIMTSGYGALFVMKYLDELYQGSSVSKGREICQPVIRAYEQHRNPGLSVPYGFVLWRLGEIDKAVKFCDDPASRLDKLYVQWILCEAPDNLTRVLPMHAAYSKQGLTDFEALEHPTVLLLLGRKTQAIDEWRQLRDDKSKKPPRFTTCYEQILNYLCDPNADSEKRLLETIGKSRASEGVSNSRLSVAYARTFIGLTRLAEGDRAAARQHFQSVVDVGPLLWDPCRMCPAMLARMDQDPGWPRWIPLKQPPSITTPARINSAHDLYPAAGQ